MGQARAVRRLNWKVLIGTALVPLVLIGIGLLAAGAMRDRVQDQVIEQAQDLIDAGNSQLAMRHLEQFLARDPDDVEVLDRYTRLLSEWVMEAGDLGRLDAAIANNERLLRLDPEGKKAEDPQRNRRWLAEMYILKTELLQADYAGLNMEIFDQEAAKENRYRSAEVVARDLIDRGAKDAEAHRLQAIAMEGMAGENRPAYLAQVVEKYEKVLEIDPGDAMAAARLARIHRDRLDDAQAADRVLEDLTRAAPDSHDAWLAVYQHYDGTDQAEKASDALTRAIDLAPDNSAVVLAAASEAIDRGDRESARALLDRLPEDRRQGPEVELLRATLDFQDRQTGDAIKRLRDALATAGGANARLVWTLANALIESQNLAEALPLVQRYEGLVGPGMEANSKYLWGLYYQKAGQPDLAISAFDAAEPGLDTDEDRSQMLVARGRNKLAVGRKYDAVQDFRTAVGLDPQSVPARLAFAEVLAGDSVDRAVQTLREGITRSPESLELQQGLLRLLLAVQAAEPADERSWGTFDGAMREARAVPSLADDPSLTALDVQRRLLEGQTDEALARLEEAVKSNPRATALWATWIDALTREGRREEALEILDLASAPEAVGDNAAFLVARAKLLSELGRGREAIEVLAQGATSLPEEQRGLIFQALGQMQAVRGQFANARASYLAWKKLQPGSAGPPLALLSLGIDTGDRGGAEEALRDLRGDPKRPPALPYLLGQAEYLIRVPGEDPAARANQALEALEPILGDPEDPSKKGAAPDLAAALLLRGLAYIQIGEERDDPKEAEVPFGKALADLKGAWERGESKAATPMVDLMVRLDRFDELDRLPRIGANGFESELDRLAAELSLRHGRNDRAAEYLTRAGDASGNTPQFVAWQMAMRDRLGQTQQVEQSLRAQAEQKGDATSWVTLIRYQAARGNREGAEQSIADMKQAVEVDPPELLEAQALEAIGEVAAAESAYEAAVAKWPDDVQVLLTSARFDQVTGRASRALERTEHALAVDPSSRPAARFLALLRAEAADDAESWRLAWETLGPEPAAEDDEGPQDRLARAIVLARHPETARREEAVGRLETLVEDQPSGDLLAVAARETLARLLLEQDRPDRAAEVAAVTAVSGTNAAAIALYAQALIAAGQVDEAGRQLGRLRNIDPDSDALVELDLRLVEAHAEAGELAEELERAYLAAVETAGTDATATAAATFRRLIGLGISAEEVASRVGDDIADRLPSLAWLPAQWHATRDEYDEALDLAKKAIDSGDPEAAFQGSRAVLTVVEHSKADPELLARADDLVQQAVPVGDLPGTRAVQAMLRHFQGRTDPSRFEDEIRIYRELLQSEPNNLIYLNNLAWALSLSGEEAEEPQRLKEALSLLDRAQEGMAARVPELLDTRAVILERLDRLDEALATLEEVSGERPNNGLYLFHLARVQDALGRADDARASMSQALELGITPEDVEPVERDTFERLASL